MPNHLPPQVLLKVEVILFDLGGVLIDIDGQRVFAHWARCAGVDAASLHSRFAMDEAYHQFERGELDAAAYFAALRLRLGIDISDGDFLAGWNAMLVGEKPGIRDVLARAATQHPLYLFSNTNHPHHAAWGVDYATMLSPFARLFVSSEIGRRKPEAAAFHYVAEAIGKPPASILFFDDSAENVDGARAVGMPAVHVRTMQDIIDVLARLEQRGLAADTRRR